MPRPVRVASSYRAVLALPGAGRAVAAVTLGRLSYATLPLSLLLAIQRSTGSYATAGASVGLFGLAGLLLPLEARLVDLFGPRRVLPVLSAGFAAALVVGAVLTRRQEAPSPLVWSVLSLAAGLFAPPLGPTMRAMWASLAPNPVLRARAYSLDAVSEEVLFAVGPLLVGALVAAGGPALALVVTAAANLAGSVGLGLVAPPATPPTGTPPGALRPGLVGWGPLRTGRFRALLGVLVLAGTGTAVVELGVVARTAGRGALTTGAVLAVLSVASAVGGLVWGVLPHRRGPRVQLGGLLAVQAGGLALVAVLPGLPALAVGVALIGVAAAPLFVVAYLAADALVAPQLRTEATTWVATASNTGLAAGAALAGVVIERTGPAVGFAAGACVLLLASVVLLGGTSRRVVGVRR